MRAPRLRRLRGEGPGPGVEVEVRPAHAGNLIAALGGQQREAEERPERIADAIGGLPDRAGIIGIKGAVPAGFLAGPLDQGNRGRVNDAAAQREIEQRADRGQGPIGGDRAARRGVALAVAAFHHAAVIHHGVE
jgi:hypothetical protein